MGKPTGFLEYQRMDVPERPLEERIQDYREVYSSVDDEKIEEQSARCMDCGIPFCHSLGCPLGNLIPEWNDLVYKGHWRDAFFRLEATNNFPEITGRICPAPCEASCTLSINDSPVTIKHIEYKIIEHAFENNWVNPRAPKNETGKRVAIIGSGPAGLAAAQQLRRNGHEVTVFEKDNRIGGILRYGIPDFKLEKWVLDRRLKQLRLEGVNFETDVIVGDDISARYLRRKFDVILLAKGARVPRDLNIPGRSLQGIHFAMDYLKESNASASGLALLGKTITAKGRNVLVIGGGDTGSDCVGTANRQGAKDVYQYEILSKPKVWTASYNPEWPDWPNILRTTTSHKEGCTRDWSILTKEFTGRNGRVQSAHCVRVNWEFPKNGGKPKPIEIPGTEFSVDVDLVLLATGFLHVEHNRLTEELGVEFDEKGNIKTQNGYYCTEKGVFVAGDAHTGASLVVRAIDHGRQAAECVNDYLS